MSSTALVRVFSPVWEPLLRCCVKKPIHLLSLSSVDLGSAHWSNSGHVEDFLVVCLLFGRSCNGAPVHRHWWAQHAGSGGGWSACVFAVLIRCVSLLKERVMPCCFSWWRWRDGGGAYDGIAWPGLFMPMTISSVLGQPAGLVPRITPCWRRSWPGCLGCGRCPSWD